jgi:microcin C transport system permease protein
MERFEYFIRRLLLVIPTFLGITILCFALTQFVPGGPVEQIMLQMRASGAEGGAQGTEALASYTEEYRKQIEAHFGFDKPLHVQYYDWLVRDRLGLMRESYKFSNKKTWELIVDRFPVSLIFGMTGFLLSYLICIPLGIAKALRHGSRFDFYSSTIVFVGYAIPAFAFGMLLKMLVAGTVDNLWDIFPVSGFEVDDFDQLSLGAKFRDRFMHMFLPVLCYVIGNFAVLTILMKNSLLDQIGSDYIRTVLAKGGTPRLAIWGHALRNALIPIATGFGGILTVMFAGSVIIEQVFEIPGMGRLSIDVVINRDYAVFMGILSLTSILALIGNIISDLCYVLIDPRINFQD